MKLPGTETAASWEGKNAPHLLNHPVLPVPARDDNACRKSGFPGLKEENLVLHALHYIFSIHRHPWRPFKALSAASEGKRTLIPKDGGSTRSKIHLMIHCIVLSLPCQAWQVVSGRSQVSPVTSQLTRGGHAEISSSLLARKGRQKQSTKRQT